MKSLIIIANPSKTSFSHAIAEAYTTGATQAGKEVEVLNLYDLDQPLLRYEDKEALRKGEINDDPIRTQIQQKITRCDEMVIVFPIRWGGIPGILKNFFDTNLGAGFAFNFVKGSSSPQKLLTDKTAKIYAHCDAPAILYKIPLISGVNIKTYLSRMILGFCGIKTTEYKIFGKLRKSSVEQREKFLGTVKVSGSKA